MTPYFSDEWLTIYQGDARDVLPSLPADSVDCIVTSPPYWGLRDYGNDGQLGLEATPEQYVANLVAVFRELRRVLKPSGTCFLNLGDSYASSGVGDPNAFAKMGERLHAKGMRYSATGNGGRGRAPSAGLKPKDLVGIPWRVAFALQQPYYTGTIRDERDRIWLAAMLDAEGCLFIHKRKTGQSNGQGYYRKNDNYGPGVEIANTSRAVVDRIMALVGKGSISTQGPDETGGRRKQTIYRWNLRTTESRDFVRELYPYLVAKQQQARLLIGCPSSGERAEAAHAGLMALHRTGVSDVDFPAPDSMFEPGWYVRSDIIWQKANPMPESVTDRPTKAHEYLFLLTKSARYFYDAEAVAERTITEPGATWEERRAAGATAGNIGVSATYQRGVHGNGSAGSNLTRQDGRRNLRSVWTIATRPYPGAHFAVFPPELPERCIKAGSSEKGACPECGAPWERIIERVGGPPPGDHRKREGFGGTMKQAHATGTVDGSALSNIYREHGYAENRTIGWGSRSCNHDTEFPEPAVVLDPFAGSGTVGLVANRLSRRAILIDLNPEYVTQQMNRNAQTPLGLGA